MTYRIDRTIVRFLDRQERLWEAYQRAFEVWQEDQTRENAIKRHKAFEAWQREFTK